MPYIPQADRDRLDYPGNDPHTPGELAYVLTKTIIAYKAEHGSTYEGLSSILGVIESVKLEFVRKAINPYENFKIERNGGLLW